MQYLNIVIIDQIAEAANISVVCGVSAVFWSNSKDWIKELNKAKLEGYTGSIYSNKVRYIILRHHGAVKAAQGHHTSHRPGMLINISFVLFCFSCFPSLTNRCEHKSANNVSCHFSP